LRTKATPILETDRLILRPINGAEDFPFWAQMMAGEASIKYLRNNKVCDEALDLHIETAKIAL